MPRAAAHLRPPRRLLGQPGPGDWQQIGRRWAEHLRVWGGLRADQRILDIGCGAGRVALGLLDGFGPDLHYGRHPSPAVRKRITQASRPGPAPPLGAVNWFT